MTSDLPSYQRRLALSLRMHGVAGPRIGEALAEVDSHVSETGQDAADAFGDPDEYAARLSSALGARPLGMRGGLVPSPWARALLAAVLGGGVGLLAKGLLALGAGEPGPFGLPALVSAGIGAALLGGLVVALAILLGRRRDPVRDPRTGAGRSVPVRPRTAGRSWPGSGAAR